MREVPNILVSGKMGNDMDMDSTKIGKARSIKAIGKMIGGMATEFSKLKVLHTLEISIKAKSKVKVLSHGQMVDSTWENGRITRYMAKVFRNGQMVVATMETGTISRCMVTACKHGRK